MSKKKIKLVGLAASPDKYGRARFLLLEELKSGKKDYSKSTIMKSVSLSAGSLPYRVWESKDGVVGEFWVQMPKRKERAALFTKIYEENRSAEMIVEVAVRYYSFQTKDEKAAKGVCLDLLDIESNKS